MTGDHCVREQIIQSMIGKNVHVVIDRPIGYRHGDMVYPINYGYIPGLIGGDGEAQDAYILGIHEPITEFDGQVIGAIRRKDDCEDKLVVAPEGVKYHQGQIAEAVHFQEQYFDTTIDSLFRKSCGVIPYRWNANEKEYLILLQTNHCWSFPKGHMEMGETEQQTALRELYEETGLRPGQITGDRVILEYDIPPFTRKQVILFLCEVEGSVVPQQSEILRHCWVTAEDLKEYLLADTYEACRPLLR